MTTKRSASVAHSATVRISKHRRVLAGCLRRAINGSGATQADVAKWLGVGIRTLYDWLSCKTRMDVEVVGACPQIGTAFRREYCTHNHDDDSVPYVARKRPRSA